MVELIVEKLDGMVNGVMGKNGAAFANYIGILFMFILLSNISGLFGLRPPTADYGVTLALGLITFTLITFNKFKYQKVSRDCVIHGLSGRQSISSEISQYRFLCLCVCSPMSFREQL